MDMIFVKLNVVITVSWRRVSPIVGLRYANPTYEAE